MSCWSFCMDDVLKTMKYQYLLDGHCPYDLWLDIPMKTLLDGECWNVSFPPYCWKSPRPMFEKLLFYILYIP